MSPSNAQRPALATRAEDAISGNDQHLFNSETRHDDQPEIELAATRRCLEGLADATDWFLDLLPRVRRAQLCVELIDHEHYDPWLEREAREWLRCVRILTWRAAP